MTHFSRNAVKQHFSRAAESYDHAAELQHALRAACVERLRRLVPEHAVAQVLDAGCGTGALSFQLTETVPAWQVTGADIAPDMCRMASSRLRHVVGADLEALPFVGGMFDAALCSLVLQWVNAPLRALSELHRVVKSGGHAVITSFGPGTLAELKAAFAAVDAHPRVSSFTSRREMTQVMEHAGWEVCDVMEQTYHSEHPDVLDLIGHLKSIGATNKHPARHKGLTTPEMFRRTEDAYRDASGEGMLPATWETYLVVLRRP